MANGPEHLKRAQELAELAEGWARGNERETAQAAVYAQLSTTHALLASTAAAIDTNPPVYRRWKPWAEAFGTLDADEAARRG